MANRILKPDSSNNLILQDGDSVSRVTLNAGGTSVLSDEGGTSALSIQADGDIDIAENIYLASGKGIYFDGGTDEKNFLGGSDAYETGTWTPVVKTNQPSFGTTVTFTGGTQTFLYTKVGNLVNVMFSVSGSTASAPSGSEVKIEGFPFTFKAGSAWYPGTPILVYSGGLILSHDSIVSGSAGNSYAIVMSHAGTGYGFSDANNSGTSYMSFQITYLME